MYHRELIRLTHRVRVLLVDRLDTLVYVLHPVWFIGPAKLGCPLEMLLSAVRPQSVQSPSPMLPLGLRDNLEMWVIVVLNLVDTDSIAPG